MIPSPPIPLVDSSEPSEGLDSLPKEVLLSKIIDHMEARYEGRLNRNQATLAAHNLINLCRLLSDIRTRQQRQATATHLPR